MDQKEPPSRAAFDLYFKTKTASEPFTKYADDEAFKESAWQCVLHAHEHFKTEDLK